MQKLKKRQIGESARDRSESLEKLPVELEQMMATRKSTKRKTGKTHSISKRVRQAGVRDDSEKIPTLTVRVRKKGIPGKPRKWDYAKVAQYICEQIAQRKTVRMVCKKIGIDEWTARAILRRPEFAPLYAQARVHQAQRFAEFAQEVADGTDSVSRKRLKKIESLHRQLKRTKNPIARDLIRDQEHILIQRNRLQLDAAKWLAKVTDPDKFGDKTTTSLTTPDGGPAISIGVQFVNPDGKVVKL